MEGNKMKLEELQHASVLTRPADNKRTIPDGAYNGETTNAELVERDSQYSDDGKRVALNIKIEVEDDEGEVVDLYIAPNYSWSKRGKMIKILEKLDVLPDPGESVDVDEIVGIPVQVIVENVEKDGETYSNIVSIKRVKAINPRNARNRKPSTNKLVVPKKSELEEPGLKKRFSKKDEDEKLEDDIPFDTDDDYEGEDDLDEQEGFDVPDDFFDED